MKNIFLFFFSLVIFSCNQKDKTKTETQSNNDSTGVKPPVTTDSSGTDSASLVKLSKEILECIKTKNYTCLAEFVDPKAGLRFSPYVYVDTATNKWFSKEEVAAFGQNKKKINWGPHDAGEDDIILTPDKYFDDFVYDLDFLKIGAVSYNRNISRGTLPNTLDSFYTSHKFVEFFIPGVDPKFDGMDWRSLHLIFKTENGKHYLVGIAHGQWTT